MKLPLSCHMLFLFLLLSHSQETDNKTEKVEEIKNKKSKNFKFPPASELLIPNSNLNYFKITDSFSISSTIHNLQIKHLLIRKNSENFPTITPDQETKFSDHIIEPSSHISIKIENLSDHIRFPIKIIYNLKKTEKKNLITFKFPSYSETKKDPISLKELNSELILKYSETEIPSISLKSDQLDIKLELEKIQKNKPFSFFLQSNNDLIPVEIEKKFHYLSIYSKSSNKDPSDQINLPDQSEFKIQRFVFNPFEAKIKIFKLGEYHMASFLTKDLNSDVEDLTLQLKEAKETTETSIFEKVKLSKSFIQEKLNIPNIDGNLKSLASYPIKFFKYFQTCVAHKEKSEGDEFYHLFAWKESLKLEEIRIKVSDKYTVFRQEQENSVKTKLNLKYINVDEIDNNGNDNNVFKLHLAEKHIYIVLDRTNPNYNKNFKDFENFQKTHFSKDDDCHWDNSGFLKIKVQNFINQIYIEKTTDKNSKNKEIIEKIKEEFKKIEINIKLSTLKISSEISSDHKTLLLMNEITIDDQEKKNLLKLLNKLIPISLSFPKEKNTKERIFNFKENKEKFLLIEKDKDKNSFLSEDLQENYQFQYPTVEVLLTLNLNEYENNEMDIFMEKDEDTKKPFQLYIKPTSENNECDEALEFIKSIKAQFSQKDNPFLDIHLKYLLEPNFEREYKIKEYQKNKDDIQKVLSIYQEQQRKCQLRENAILDVFFVDNKLEIFNWIFKYNFEEYKEELKEENNKKSGSNLPNLIPFNFYAEGDYNYKELIHFEIKKEKVQVADDGDQNNKNASQTAAKKKELDFTYLTILNPSHDGIKNFKDKNICIDLKDQIIRIRHKTNSNIKAPKVRLIYENKELSIESTSNKNKISEYKIKDLINKIEQFNFLEFIYEEIENNVKIVPFKLFSEISDFKFEDSSEKEKEFNSYFLSFLVNSECEKLIKLYNKDIKIKIQGKKNNKDFKILEATIYEEPENRDGSFVRIRKENTDDGSSLVTPGTAAKVQEESKAKGVDDEEILGQSPKEEFKRIKYQIDMKPLLTDEDFVLKRDMKLSFDEESNCILFVTENDSMSFDIEFEIERFGMEQKIFKKTILENFVIVLIVLLYLAQIVLLLVIVYFGIMHLKIVEDRANRRERLMNDYHRLYEEE